MILATRARLAFAAAGMAIAVLIMPASAQDLSDTHLKAARHAIDALGTTDRFDEVLPQAAHALKGQLIQKNPDLVELINATVDKNALELASRRADLEQEAATAYARVFSEEELNSITEFFNSPTGKKLLSDEPIAQREILKAAQIWQNGIARDLAQSVGEEIAAAVAANSGGQAGQDEAQPGEPKSE